MTKLKKVKLIVLDVDGVLTDGKLYIGSHGVEFKSFHVKDGMGINLARYHGIKIALITGRKSEAVNIRSREMNVDFLYEGIRKKEEALFEIISSLNINLNQVFYMGDDLNDLPIIKLVGSAGAPKDATEMVKEAVDFVSDFPGGNGSVRETIEFILSHQVDLNMLVEKYLNEQTEIIQ